MPAPQAIAVPGVQVPEWTPVRCVATGVSDTGAEAPQAAAVGLVVDGVTLQSGDRVLVVTEYPHKWSGIYVAGSGSGTRATDANESSEFVPGKRVTVTQGQQYAGSVWRYAGPAGPTIGQSSLIFLPLRPQSAPLRRMLIGLVPEWEPVLCVVTGLADTLAAVQGAVFHQALADGMQMTEDDRVLVVTRPPYTYSGIWQVADGGPVRPDDANAANDFAPGKLVRVLNGTRYRGSVWQYVGPDSPLVGNTGLPFQLFTHLDTALPEPEDWTPVRFVTNGADAALVNDLINGVFSESWGHSVAPGDRVLFVDSEDPKLNGIYVAGPNGGRAPDANQRWHFRKGRRVRAHIHGFLSAEWCYVGGDYPNIGYDALPFVPLAGPKTP